MKPFSYTSYLPPSPWKAADKQHQRERIQALAYARFSPKSYQEEHRLSYRAYVGLGYCFQAISLVLAYGFVHVQVKALLAGWAFEIAVIGLSLALLLLIEITKRVFVSRLLASLYQDSYPLIVSLFALAALSCSVYWSVQGAGQLVVGQVNKEGAISQSTQSKSDSLRRYYAAQMEGLRQERQHFLAQISYQGKVNLYHPPTAEHLAAYDRQLSELETEKKALLQERDAQKEQALSNNETRVGLLSGHLLYVSLANELLLVLCLLGISRYLGRVYLESRAGNPADTDATGAETETASPDQKQGPHYIDYVAKYPEAARLLGQGLSVQEVMGQAGLSRQTVIHVRRALRRNGQREEVV